MRRGTSLTVAVICAATVAVICAAAGIGGCGGSLAKPEGGADATACITQIPVQPLTGTPCRYALPAPPCDDTDRARIGVKIAGNEIPRDTLHQNGWDYTDATMEMVEVYGPSCDALSASPGLPVTIVFKLLLI